MLGDVQTRISMQEMWLGLYQTAGAVCMSGIHEFCSHCKNKIADLVFTFTNTILRIKKRRNIKLLVTFLATDMGSVQMKPVMSEDQILNQHW